MSGLFKSFRNYFSRSAEEGAEEALDEFAEPADVSFTPTDVDGVKVYSVDAAVEGADIPFFHRERDTKDVLHEEFQYRLEHEPYRFEPDSDMTVCVTKANLYEIHPLTQSVNIWELSPLTIQVTDNCVVYSQFGTNDHGQVISEYILLMAEGTEVPASTHFVLPDENGGNGVGGTYNIPLFWIKNRKLYRNFWDDTADPHRQTKLMGGLEGHRGPMWWIKGYNALFNVGNGQKVYKDYTIGTDFKNLRTLIEKGQDGLSSPFSGEAQVQVETNGDEIEIYGNRYNKWWKIGTYGVGIVEDGLVTCLGDLSCHNLVNRTVPTASVLTSSGTTSVVNTVTVGPNSNAAAATPASTATVLTSGSTTDDVWRGGTTNSTMWQGGAVDTTMWHGGTLDTESLRGGTAFPASPWGIHKITQGSGGTDAIWVMGVPATGDYSSGAPSAPTLRQAISTTTCISGASAVTGIRDATHETGITGASQVDDVVTSTGTASAVTGLTPLSCVTSVASTTYTVLSSSGGTVSVYQASGSDHKFLTAPAEQMGDSSLSVVACPTANICPPP